MSIGSDNPAGVSQGGPSPSRALMPADVARAQAGKRSKRVDGAPLPADVARGVARRGEAESPDPDPSRPGRNRGIASPVSASALQADDVRGMRKKKAAIAVIVAALALFSLCITSSTPMLVSPLEVVQCYAVFMQRMWAQLFDPASLSDMTAVLAAHPTYYWTLYALNRTVILLICGFMLALSGALYQNAFRNPIAAPSMLGVSSGIELATAVSVLLFGGLAGELVLESYAISYCAVGLVMAILFGLALLMTGKGRPFNVTNLLLAGVILNSFIGVIVTFITETMFDEEMFDLFLSLSGGARPAMDAITWAFLIAGLVVSFAPVFALRFRMNALAFSPDEARMFGVRTTRLQLLALACGTVAMVTAQLQVGAVAMITLVVPHLSRAVFGAEFRKQFAGTVLMGAGVLMLCYVVASLLVAPFPDLFPLSVVVNLVLLPAFVWMIATQQRRWD